jgi:hypothetical protein
MPQTTAPAKAPGFIAVLAAGAVITGFFLRHRL